MKLKDLTLNELESMGYDEIAQLILEETGKKQTLINIFKKICNLLEIDFESNADNVTHFFELLSTNKKFVMLDNGYWDLQINHKANIIIEHEDEEHIDSFEVDEIEEETKDENIFYDNEENDDVVDDEFANLVVVDEEEEAN